MHQGRRSKHSRILYSFGGKYCLESLTIYFHDKNHECKTIWIITVFTLVDGYDCDFVIMSGH